MNSLATGYIPPAAADPLCGRRILLVSPQGWDHIAISKHHYALELARRGNEVYFLEPPVAGLGGKVSLMPVEGAPGVTVVRYSLRHPQFLRFHARPVFDRLMRGDIARIRRAIGGAPDVVWSFDVNLFTDLRSFGAPLCIFHPVDAIASPHQVAPARSATVVLTVSDVVQETLRRQGVETHFVNHGLSEAFAAYARRPAEAWQRADGPLRVGYVGNLLHPSLDHEALSRCIDESPEVDFHIWGPTAAGAGQGERPGFLDTLASRPNVHLHGPVDTKELARQIQAMDAFLLAYSSSAALYDSSNSHKILEYLSTGRVVVGSRVSAYAGRRDLVVMSEDATNERLPELLREVLSAIDVHNADERIAARRRFALEHTYSTQLDRIAACCAAALMHPSPMTKQES